MDKLIEEYFNIVNKKQDVLKEDKEDYRQNDPFYYRSASSIKFDDANPDDDFVQSDFSEITRKDIGAAVSYYDPADPAYGDEAIKAQILDIDKNNGKIKIQPLMKDEKTQMYVPDPDESPIFVNPEHVTKTGDDISDAGKMETAVDPHAFDNIADPSTNIDATGDFGQILDDRLGWKKADPNQFSDSSDNLPPVDPRDLNLESKENMNTDTTNSLEDLSLDVHFGKQETITECGDSCNCDKGQCDCDKEDTAQPKNEPCKCGKKPHRKFFNKQPEKTPEMQIKESLEKGFAF